MSKPIDTIRSGAIKCPIWENETDDGKTYYTVTSPIRFYKDGEDYKETTSLSNGELLIAARLLEKAFDRIDELKAANRQQAAA